MDFNRYIAESPQRRSYDFSNTDSENREPYASYRSNQTRYNSYLNDHNMKIQGPDEPFQRNFRIEPMFDGSLGPQHYLDWITDMDNCFDWYRTTDNKKVRFATMRLTGQAKRYWTSLENKRKRCGEWPVEDWNIMKQQLKLEYYPPPSRRESYSNPWSHESYTSTYSPPTNQHFNRPTSQVHDRPVLSSFQSRSDYNNNSRVKEPPMIARDTKCVKIQS